MRVYELAKKLGMENRDLIPELKRLGIAVASHSSTLDDEAARLALEKIGPKVKSYKADEVVSSHELSGHGQDTKRVAKSKDAGGPHDTSSRLHTSHTEEAARPDKKRILIKRKKEEGAEDIAPLAAAPESSHPIPPMSQPASLSAPTHVAPAAPEPAPSAERESIQPAETAVPDSTPPAVAAEPKIPPVVPPKPAAIDTLAPVGKKKSFSIESLEAEGRDKAKKARKGPRQREEEDVRFRDDATRWQDLRAIPVQRRDDRSNLPKSRNRGRRA